VAAWVTDQSVIMFAFAVLFAKYSLPLLTIFEGLLAFKSAAGKTSHVSRQS